MLVIHYFPTNSQFSHNSKTKLPSLHVKHCLHNTMTGVYEVEDLYFVHITFDIYWVDTSAGGLLIPESIIRPVDSVSALKWFIRYIYF
jgi:hypothetical protein